MGLVATASLWVKNAGREAATEVELTFNYKPQFYNMWPARHFEPITGIANRHTLKFSSIAPNEEFYIEMISSGQQLPEIVSFRSKEGVAKLVAMHFGEKASKFVVTTAVIFIFIGFVTFIYFILLLIAPYVPFLRQS